MFGIVSEDMKCTAEPMGATKSGQADSWETPGQGGHWVYKIGWERVKGEENRVQANL